MTFNSFSFVLKAHDALIYVVMHKNTYANELIGTMDNVLWLMYKPKIHLTKHIYNIFS
jgi:hypothetical protein